MKGRFVSLCLLVMASPAAAATTSEAQTIEAAVAEASAAFGLPEALIRRVIARESAADPRAVSRAGAMGLMQLMPPTWREIRARLRLGRDPFDVRDNVVAGAAYLRDMHDRFGPAGFLAAYNAGPGRYAEVLAGRAQLPRETRAYVAAFAPSDGALAAPVRSWRRSALAPAGAGLFPSVGGETP